MNWKQEWKAISARIESLLAAGNFLMAAHSAVSSEDPWGANRLLIGDAVQVFETIKRFRDRYGPSIPQSADDCIRKFITNRAVYLTESLDQSAQRFHGMKTMLTLLAAFRSELTYLLQDTEAAARSLVERAFLHLQRSIVADPSLSTRWKQAFVQGELACERLGAAHLLVFGIYSFKANAEGERTDIILGQRLMISEVENAAEALVLTEWKMVRRPETLLEISEQAYQQARRYTAGSLAGFELASRRYLVLVSEKSIQMPDSRTEGGCIYEHKNIAVDPDVPSQR
jgi:hypothetical protein